MFRGTAHVYDLIYQAVGKDYAAESEQVTAAILARNPSAESVLDVACGTGGHLRHLHDRFEVTGVDIDPGMLEQARKVLPGVELIEADMRSLQLGRRFDAVICLFSSIGYMQSAEELGSAVAAMARHLDPGGVLLIDGWVKPEDWRDPGSTHVEVADTENLKVARVGRAVRDGNKTYLEMHHLIATRDGVDHVVDEHVLTLFSDEQYRQAFEGCGLGVVTTPSPMPGRDRYTAQAPEVWPVSR